MYSENVISRCEQCGKCFPTGSSLRAHQHRNHSGRKFICYHCRYETNFKHVLQKHIHRIHFTLKVDTPRHKCPLCNTFTALVRQTMLDHYNEIHNVNLNKKMLAFNSVDDFNRWKREREKADCCQFVLSKGGRRTGRGELTRYFRCSRDGRSRIKRTGKRQSKKKGSVKTNSVCPCSIKAVETPSGVCRIEYVSTHVGHTCDVDKLQLSRQERDDIAQKLAARMPLDVILESTRESMSNGNLSRLSLTTRKDLHNIKRRLHLQQWKPDVSSPETDTMQSLETSVEDDDREETVILHDLSEKQSSTKQPGFDLMKWKHVLTNTATNIIDSIHTQEDFVQAYEIMMMIPPTLAAQRRGLIFTTTYSDA